jgi:N-acetylgalactosamine-6-sulfatase
MRLLTFLALCLLAAGRAHAAPPPNILFILADDLGWGDLGCYGHPTLKTPRLDRLAREGTLFTQYYANGSVCSPTRAALMTGQYPARHRIHGHFATPQANADRGMAHWLDPQAPNLAALLSARGYATAHIGKWHLGDGPDAPPPSRYGFDHFRTMDGPGRHWREPLATFMAKSTGLFADEAIAFLREPRDRPFFINLWTFLPHAPLNPTAAQMEPFKNFSWGGHRSAETIYFAAVNDVDQQVGRVLDALEELGLAGNTLVIFSSDNGPEDIHLPEAGHSGVGSAGPFRGRKRSLYEGGVRVPFIVRWPGRVPAGKVNTASVVSGVDLLPTIARLVGASLPAGHAPDGEAMDAAWLGRDAARTRDLHWEYRFPVRGDAIHHSPQLALREGDWKLLMNPDRSRVELYDLARDLTQTDNLAAQHPEVAARLAEKLLAWQKSLPAGPANPQAGRINYRMPGS